jgi:hypothetical protein
LTLLPLSPSERRLFALLARILTPRLLWLVAATVATLAAGLALPRPMRSLAEAASLLFAAALLGLAWALAAPGLAGRVPSARSRTGLPKPHPFPLFRKEFLAFARLLEPWLVLLLALAAALTEWLGGWMSPARAFLPFWLFAVFLLPGFLHPFGLESGPERERYRLLPLPWPELVARKHGALALIFLLSTLPLPAVLALRLSFVAFAETLMVYGLTLGGCLLAGALWHNQPAARRIHLAPGALSGSNMPLDLALEAALLTAAAPVLFLAAVHNLAPTAVLPLGCALLALVVLLYRRLLRRCREQAN